MNEKELVEGLSFLNLMSGLKELADLHEKNEERKKEVKKEIIGIINEIL